MIDVLTQKVCSLYGSNNKEEYTVVVLAPTGLAAFNINGLTIHRFFKLPVQNILSHRYKSRKLLSKDDSKMMKRILKNLKLIIIGISRFLNFH